MKIKKGLGEFLVFYIAPMAAIATTMTLLLLWCANNYYKKGLVL